MAAIVHTRMARLYAGPRTVSGTMGGGLLQTTVTASLSLETCVLPADSSGNVTSYAAAVTTMTVRVGGVDTSAQWSFSRINGDGVSSSLSSNTLTISNLTADSGYVDITATRSGYDPIPKRFSLSRAKAGTSGTSGDWVSYVFKQAATQPAAPTGTASIPSGWLDSPPASYTNPIWMSKATVSGNTGLAGAWSTPIRVTGADGSNGASGQYTVYQYAKNGSTTTAPTSGWSDVPYSLSSGEYQWMRSGIVVPPDTSPGSWGAAYRVSGEKGDPGSSGSPGSPGSPGVRGTIVTKISGSWSDSTANSQIYSVAVAAGATPTTPIKGDIVYYTGGAKEYTGSSWIAVAAYIDGSLVVNGTIAADSIAAGTMTGSTVRTSNSSTRVELSAVDNTLRVYNAGTNTVTLGGLGSGYVSVSGSGVGVWVTTSGVNQAIYGLNTANNASAPGIKGESPYGIGVYAASTYGIALVAACSGGTAIQASGSLQWGSYAYAQPNGTTNSFLSASGGWAVPQYLVNAAGAYMQTGSYKATMQTDGNFVVYNGASATFASNSALQIQGTTTGSKTLAGYLIVKANGSTYNIPYYTP